MKYLSINYKIRSSNFNTKLNLKLSVLVYSISNKAGHKTASFNIRYHTSVKISKFNLIFFLNNVAIGVQRNIIAVFITDVIKILQEFETVNIKY